MGWSVLLAAEAVQAAEAVKAVKAARRDQASLLGFGPQKWLRLERAKSPAGETEETSPWSLPA